MKNEETTSLLGHSVPDTMIQSWKFSNVLEVKKPVNAGMKDTKWCLCLLVENSLSLSRILQHGKYYADLIRIPLSFKINYQTSTIELGM